VDGFMHLYLEPLPAPGDLRTAMAGERLPTTGRPVAADG